MARIVGIDIPRNKKIVFSLCYIHGIGTTTALKICEMAKVDKEKRVQDLSEKQISSIREIISRGSKVIIITHVESSELNDLSDNVFVISNKDKYAFSILATIVLQKLAFFSCLNLGLDPDRPDNLAKTVTVE